MMYLHPLIVLYALKDFMMELRWWCYTVVIDSIPIAWSHGLKNVVTVHIVEQPSYLEDFLVEF